MLQIEVLVLGEPPQGTLNTPHPYVNSAVYASHTRHVTLHRCLSNSQAAISIGPESNKKCELKMNARERLEQLTG